MHCEVMRGEITGRETFREGLGKDDFLCQLFLSDLLTSKKIWGPPSLMAAEGLRADDKNDSDRN